MLFIVVLDCYLVANKVEYFVDRNVSHVEFTTAVPQPETSAWRIHIDCLVSSRRAQCLSYEAAAGL